MTSQRGVEVVDIPEFKWIRAEKIKVRSTSVRGPLHVAAGSAVCTQLQCSPATASSGAALMATMRAVWQGWRAGLGGSRAADKEGRHRWCRKPCIGAQTKPGPAARLMQLYAIRAHERGRCCCRTASVHALGACQIQRPQCPCLRNV